MSARVLSWITLFLMMLAVGCQPAVQLKSAALRGATPTGVQFDAVLSIENPNVFDVQLRALRANAKIEGVGGYIPITIEPATWIPAGRKVLIGVPVVLPWSMIPAILAATISESKVAYTVRGTADVTATRAFQIDRDMYKFDEEGELPRSFFLSVSRGGLSLGLGQ